MAARSPWSISVLMARVRDRRRRGEGFTLWLLRRSIAKIFYKSRKKGIIHLVSEQTKCDSP